MALPDVSPYIQPNVNRPIQQIQPVQMPQVNNNIYLPKHEVGRVNGYDGALNYPMGPDSSEIVLDEKLSVMWFIATDHRANKIAVQGQYIGDPYDPPKPITMDDIMNEIRGMNERLMKMEEERNVQSNYRSNGQIGSGGSSGQSGNGDSKVYANGEQRARESSKVRPSDAAGN